jgi:hypothetical protein
MRRTGEPATLGVTGVEMAGLCQRKGKSRTDAKRRKKDRLFIRNFRMGNSTLPCSLGIGNERWDLLRVFLSWENSKSKLASGHGID